MRLHTTTIDKLGNLMEFFLLSNIKMMEFILLSVFTYLNTYRKSYGLHFRGHNGSTSLRLPYVSKTRALQPPLHI